MSLAKVSLFNGIAVAVKAASALVLNKVLAVYVGPSGYAIIGQFQNLVSIVVSLSGGLISSGVTKSTAQNFDDEEKQRSVWQTAIRLSIAASFVMGLAIIFASQLLSEWLLNLPSMASIFIWLALALPAMAANNLLLAIINGKNEIKVYVAANIIGSMLAMLLTSLLAYNFGLYGALVAFTINPIIVLFSTSLMISRRHWFKVHFLWGKIDSSALIELSGFGLMGLTSALAIPFAFVLIRNYLITHLGMNAAGYWQASWKISEIFLMLVTSTLTVYYLPRLAQIRTANELKDEILKVYRFVMPFVIIGALAIYTLRDFIIHTLFADEFYPMRELFAWQLAGDIVKIGSWILAYIMIGRAMVRAFVISEIVFSIFFVLCSWWLVDLFGLVGVPMAYVINYSLYWVAMIFLARQEMRMMEREA